MKVGMMVVKGRYARGFRNLGLMLPVHSKALKNLPIRRRPECFELHDPENIRASYDVKNRKQKD